MYFLFSFTAPLPKKSPLCINNDFPNLYLFAFSLTGFSSFTQSYQVMETNAWTCPNNCELRNSGPFAF
jgi:hypothetical protein